MIQMNLMKNNFLLINVLNYTLNHTLKYAVFSLGYFYTLKLPINILIAILGTGPGLQTIFTLGINISTTVKKILTAVNKFLQ